MAEMNETKMQLEDWLDDLCVRFIINLPEEDLSTVARICFQVEEAHWFYEDFLRAENPLLPTMNLRKFCMLIFKHCPLLASFSEENHMRAFDEFMQYKTRVPVRGAILLNEAMDSTVLVKGWKKNASWSFPRGKINKDEDDLDCAIREVYEETGFDIRASGLVPAEKDTKYIEVSMHEQQVRLYVFRNIPMDTYFEPRTRKEISDVKWYKLSQLPAFRKKKTQDSQDTATVLSANKVYMVAPFLVHLKKWVVQQQQKDAEAAARQLHLTPSHHEDTSTEGGITSHAQPLAQSVRATPAIETLEGANEELRRLLKVQPPTQGLQVPEASFHVPDHGGSLLALLRGSSGGPQHETRPTGDKPPITPLERIYSHPPGPHTPHHHHPTQQAPLASYGPPPPFPGPVYANQNLSATIYNQQMHLPNQYGQPRQGPHQQGPRQQAPFQQTSHQQGPYQQGPYQQGTHQQVPQLQVLHPPGQPRNGQPQQGQPQRSQQQQGLHPQSLHPQGQHTAGHYPQAQHSFNMSAHQAASNPAQREAIPLLHPQPLPPQVQQTLLSRGIVPSPGAPDAGASAALPHNAKPGTIHDLVQKATQLRAPVSHTHTASLLNAFKSNGAQRTGNPEGVQNASQGPQVAVIESSAQVQSASWTTTVPVAGSVQRPGQQLASNSVPNQHMATNTVSHISSQLAPAQPRPTTDTQRNALLDIFKQPMATSLPKEAHSYNPTDAPKPVPVASQSNSKPGYVPTSNGRVIEAAAHANGGPITMNPELNLPFGALSVLFRPKETLVVPNGQANEGKMPHSPGAESVATVKPNVMTPRQLPPILPMQGQANLVPTSIQQLPSFGQRPLSNSSYQGFTGGQVSGVTTPGVSVPAAQLAQRAQDANPVQQKKLLSLFSLPQMQAASAAADPKGKGKAKELPIMMPSQLQPSGSHARLASLASTVGDNGAARADTSRRGSEAPISPADRNFLLGYLESRVPGGTSR